MMNIDYLQLFLFANVFIMGVVCAIAVRHAFAHFRPRPKAAPKLQTLATPTQVHLSQTTKDRLVHEAEASFVRELNRSVGELQQELKNTASQMTRQLAQLGAQVVISEKGRYADMLAELRQQTEQALHTAQTDITEHEAALKAKLTEEQAALKAKMGEQIAAEQQRLLAQIDTKLADAVGSFLTETLQHNVDLGAQMPYLTKLLEEHKDDFKKEVADESKAAK